MASAETAIAPVYPEILRRSCCVGAREAVACSTMHTIRLIELSAAVAVTRGPQRCGVDRKPLRLERATFSLELRHGRPRDRRDTVRAFEFMNRNRAMFPIATMARVLAVSKTGYHAWPSPATGPCALRRGGRDDDSKRRCAARSCSSMPEQTAR